jgi:hypothetical protein
MADTIKLKQLNSYLLGVSIKAAIILLQIFKISFSKIISGKNLKVLLSKWIYKNGMMD